MITMNNENLLNIAIKKHTEGAYIPGVIKVYAGTMPEDIDAVPDENDLVLVIDSGLESDNPIQ